MSLAPDAMLGSQGEHSCDELVRMIDSSADGSGENGTEAGAVELRSALDQCPEDERLWYLLARYSEADAIPVQYRQFADSKTAIETAFKRFPTSRIATVRARVLGTVDAAQTAVQIDPSYRPARIALAGALLRGGHANDALEILEPMARSFSNEKLGLQYSFTGWLTLARARLAAGDPPGALKAARRAGGLELDDTYALRPRVSDYEWWTVSGLAALSLKDYPQSAHMLLMASARGSTEGLAELQRASSPLRNRVAAIVRNPATFKTEQEREYRSVAVGIGAWLLGDYEEAVQHLLVGLHGRPRDRVYVSSLIRDHTELASALRACVAAKRLPADKMDDARKVLEGDGLGERRLH